MSAPHIILASLPSFSQKLSKLAEIWQSSDKNNFACFFETWCSRDLSSEKLRSFAAWQWIHLWHLTFMSCLSLSHHSMSHNWHFTQQRPSHQASLYQGWTTVTACCVTAQKSMSTDSSESSWHSGTSSASSTADCKCNWSEMVTALAASEQCAAVHKTSLLTYKTLLSGHPMYWHGLIQCYRPTRNLRPSSSALMHLAPVINNLENCTFCVPAPHVWNSLTHKLRALMPWTVSRPAGWGLNCF